MKNTDRNKIASKRSGENAAESKWKSKDLTWMIVTLSLIKADSECSALLTLH